MTAAEVPGIGAAWRSGQEVIGEIGTLTPGCASGNHRPGRRVLCPGFVDVHSHSDFSAFLVNGVDGKITRAITAEVVSNCGLAMTPSVPEKAGLLQEYMRPYLPEGVSLPHECGSLEEMMDRMRSSGYVTDLAFHVAHGPLRIIKLWVFDNRKTSPAELELMKKGLLAREMESGAVGLEGRLIYPPVLLPILTSSWALPGRGPWGEHIRHPHAERIGGHPERSCRGDRYRTEKRLCGAHLPS